MSIFQLFTPSRYRNQRFIYKLHKESFLNRPNRIFSILVKPIMPVMSTISNIAHISQQNIITCSNNMFALIIHGGAGAFSKEEMKILNEATDCKDLAEVYKQKMIKITEEGKRMLKNGVAAKDVVIYCVKEMEDDEYFNAGKGALPNEHGSYSVDASLMDGTTKDYGAVMNYSNLKNPINCTNELINTKQMLTVNGNDDLFTDKDRVNNSYYKSEFKMKIEETLRKHKVKYSTVGAVALDISGNISSGTSTGGIYNKIFGRIGDTGIIGAGTYADSNFAGISCSGHGELFVRDVVAYDIIAKMKYKNITLEEAMTEKISELDKEAGGFIGIDKDGNIKSTYNSKGFYRSWYDSKTDPVFSIWE